MGLIQQLGKRWGFNRSGSIKSGKVLSKRQIFSDLKVILCSRSHPSAVELKNEIAPGAGTFGPRSWRGV